MGAKVAAILPALTLFLVIFAGIGIGNSIMNQSKLSLPASHAVGRQLAEEINATAGYIRTVNQSAYFFFYPNLRNAYAYLNEANSIAARNGSKATSLLVLARSSAAQSLSNIMRYEEYSIIALIIITGLSGFGMYKLMRIPPSRKSGKTTTSRAKVKE